MLQLVIEELPESPLAQVDDKLRQIKYLFTFMLLTMFIIAIMMDQAATRHFVALLICNTFCFVCTQQKLDFVIVTATCMYCIYAELMSALSQVAMHLDLKLLVFHLLYCLVYYFGIVIRWRSYQLMKFRWNLMEEIVREMVANNINKG